MINTLNKISRKKLKSNHRKLSKKKFGGGQGSSRPLIQNKINPPPQNNENNDGFILISKNENNNNEINETKFNNNAIATLNTTKLNSIELQIINAICIKYYFYILNDSMLKFNDNAFSKAITTRGKKTDKILLEYLQHIDSVYIYDVICFIIIRLITGSFKSIRVKEFQCLIYIINAYKFILNFAKKIKSIMRDDTILLKKILDNQQGTLDFPLNKDIIKYFNNPEHIDFIQTYLENKINNEDLNVYKNIETFIQKLTTIKRSAKNRDLFECAEAMKCEKVILAEYINIKDNPEYLAIKDWICEKLFPQLNEDETKYLEKEDIKKIVKDMNDKSLEELFDIYKLDESNKNNLRNLNNSIWNSILFDVK